MESQQVYKCQTSGFSIHISYSPPTQAAILSIGGIILWHIRADVERFLIAKSQQTGQQGSV